MAQGTLWPWPIQIAWNPNGTLSPGAKANFYLAGTTTPVAVFSDVLLNTAISQPVTADGNGRFPEIYLTPGTSVKVAITDSSGTALPGYPADNILPVPPSSANQDVTGTAGVTLTAGLSAYLSDGSGGKTAGLWYLADSANAYSSTGVVTGILPATIASGAS